MCKDPATPPTQAANKKRRQKNENENSAFNSYLLIGVGIGAVLVQLGLVESRKKTNTSTMYCIMTRKATKWIFSRFHNLFNRTKRKESD